MIRGWRKYTRLQREAAAIIAEDQANRCRCGHPEEIHQHYRDSTDCGQCGRAVCPRYRRAARQGGRQ